MTGPTAHDYLWAADDYLGEYCVTVVPGLVPAEVLRRWSADRLGTVDGYEHLGELALDAWTEHRGEVLPVGVAALADGAGSVVMEVNGYVAIVPRLARALSAGTCGATSYTNVNRKDRFQHVRDGVVELDLDQLFPDRREGSAPDRYLDQIVASGFELGGDDDDEVPEWWSVSRAAALALVERLTGLAVPRAVFGDAQLQVGWVRVG